MRRYNIVSRILLIFTVITFALAAPALVQEKRQARVDVVHVPDDVITVLKKRAWDQDLWLYTGSRYYENLWGNDDLNLAGIHLEPAPPEVHVPPPNSAVEHVPPPNPAEVHVPEVHVPPPNPAEVHVPEVHVPPPNPAEVHVPGVHVPPPNNAEVHVPPQDPADSDRESMDLHDDAPPASPEWSTDSDSDRWSTISNAPSAESLSENLKAADSEITQMRGKAKVERRISGTASGVDTVKCGSDGVAEYG